MIRFFLKYCVLLPVAFVCGCVPVSKKEASPDVSEIVAKPLSPEKSQEMLETVGENWLYGEGFGSTAITAGAIVVFPPYALWVLGNAALSLSGYEQIKLSDALPKESGDAWDGAYTTVASGPGRLAAAIAGREYRSTDVSKERLEEFIPASTDRK